MWQPLFQNSTSYISPTLCVFQNGTPISKEDNENVNELLNDDLLANFNFYGQGCLVAIMGAFGVLGNVMAIVTITSMNKVSLFYKLLIGLAFFDIIFLINGGLFIAQTAFKFKSQLYFQFFPSVIYPAAAISMTGMYD